MAIKIALAGASGRMGQMIAELVDARDDLVIAAATASQNSAHLGEKIGMTEITADLSALGLGSGGVIIDFTRPEATMRHLQIAVESKTPILIGTTSLNEKQEATLRKAATKIPVMYCANTSLGVNLLEEIIEQIASKLDMGWDIEIVETHHNQKTDAPSGTALALGQAAARGRGISFAHARTSPRDGINNQRQTGDIGFSSLRGGDVAGEHTVSFFGPQERIEITHRATSRIIFARGALDAAQYIALKTAGLYSMRDLWTAAGYSHVE